MRYSLRTKLSTAFVGVALISILLLSILANIFLEKQFKEYVMDKQERRNRDIVSLISQQYKGDGKWAAGTVEDIGINALEEGLVIKVRDASGNIVWDAEVHNSGLCARMLSHMAQNMKSRYPNWKGEYIENRYPVKTDFAEAGSVEIGFFGPYYFNDNDLAFINTLNKMLAGVGLFSLLLALALGAYMAKRISRPILRVSEAAGLISRGLYNERINEKSGTREIRQLTESINQLAESLKSQESLRRRLTSDVAHELRTPLATLQSHMEAMIDGIWKPDEQRLKSCHEEIARISRMVGDLEKLARYEGECLVLNKSRFDLSELIQGIVRNFESDFKNKGVELYFNTGKLEMPADRDKMSQVIVNLLSNALKYTPSGGKVEIEAGQPGEAIEIVVRDNGIGIAPEDLPYIFERFYRADKSRNRLTGGSGIGLAIVKAIVEAHHGNISVRSEPGNGTEFVILLPHQNISS